MAFSPLPLSEHVRPLTLEAVFGQDHLAQEAGWLTKVIQSKEPLSILLWGPPGCGKTTLAKIYLNSFPRAQCLSFSASLHAISDIKKSLAEAHEAPFFYQRLLIFIDEIHRLNKAQQDFFLPLLEQGKIILVGATTENPSFALNDALLSRLRVLHLKALDASALLKILRSTEEKLGLLSLTEEAEKALIQVAYGDARHLLNMIETLHKISVSGPIDEEKLFTYIQKRPALYDKNQDQHYQLISALHKAIRGSDPDASLYWLARMLEGGEDCTFLARRLIRVAAEDIGLADPHALEVTVAAFRGYEHLGSPEGDLLLAQAVVYLALSPKSNALYTAFSQARALASSTAHIPPPSTIINAATPWMKKVGFGQGYAYDHETPDAFSGQEYFPEALGHPHFYTPKERGYERELKKRLDYFSKLRKKLKKEPS